MLKFPCLLPPSLSLRFFFFFFTVMCGEMERDEESKGNRVVVTLPVARSLPPPLFDPAAPYPRLAFPFVGSCRGGCAFPLPPTLFLLSF